MPFHLADSPVRALHITASIGKGSHGLGQVAVNLTKAQTDLNADARIWCLDPPDQIDWAISLPGLAREQVKGFPQFPPARLGFSRAMLADARKHGNKFDVVHQHGIWTACSFVSNTLRRMHGIPIVIAPHGSLQTWALQRSRLKKAFALAAYERANLNQAGCLHATAESEISDFRNFGLQAPVAVIRNGISERWLNSRGDGEAFRHAYGIPSDRRILFFLSRITPKKGLIMLIEALHAMRQEFADWILVIAGTDEFDHKAEVSALVERLGMQETVKIIGPQFDQSKRDAFAAADLFVLPSYSEGAPVVVLDSLAVGVPVITTKGAPWQDLVTYQCGWWTDISVGGLLEALRGAVGSSRETLDAMGQRGRALVASQYRWATLAQKTIELYEWLLGRRDRPDFVVHD